MFIARGATTPDDDPMALAAENNGAKIPANAATVAVAHGTGVAGDIPPGMSVAGAQLAPNTTDHRQTAGGQVPSSLQRLLIGTPPSTLIPRSRNEYP